MNELQIFKNQEFGEIRTTIIDGEPWFVAADVCRALDIDNPSQAITRLDADERNTIILNEGIGNPNKTIVNEPGLYSLVLGSRKPEAKAFKRWITHDVIPSIRKTGTYGIPKSLPEALRLAADLAEKLEAQKPMVQLAEKIMPSADTLLIREFAKVIGWGEKRLYQWLRDNHIMYRKDGRNLPYQEYIDRGYFEVTETPFIADGETCLALTSRIAVKGQQYIINKLAV